MNRKVIFEYTDKSDGSTLAFERAREGGAYVEAFVVQDLLHLDRDGMKNLVKALQEELKSSMPLDDEAHRGKG